eukprot:1800672-Amphidinium_carterae.1
MYLGGFRGRLWPLAIPSIGAQEIAIPTELWTWNAHVYLIGKASEQWEDEHQASRCRALGNLVIF